VRSCNKNHARVYGSILSTKLRQGSLTTLAYSSDRTLLLITAMDEKSSPTWVHYAWMEASWFHGLRDYIHGAGVMSKSLVQPRLITERTRVKDKCQCGYTRTISVITQLLIRLAIWKDDISVLTAWVLPRTRIDEPLWLACIAISLLKIQFCSVYGSVLKVTYILGQAYPK
jgi:hypothetical protein